MSLTVKHLNNDSSFLLAFEPFERFGNSSNDDSNKFTVLLDPWLSGTSKIWHSKFSISKHKVPSCVSSLSDLPEPDLVIISQDKTDHCHEPTLKSLPPAGTKTIILAPASAAKMIRGWKYFEPSKIVVLPKWEGSSGVNPTIHRITLPGPDPQGLTGEVTVSYLSQKHDITSLHSAIGITYRSPTSSAFSNPLASLPLTPPASPTSSSPTAIDTRPASRALSVLYSPHGVTYNTLEPYVTSHLVSEAALPLTALLHSFDQINNPWYLGGNICAGFPGGAQIAQKLLAKCWISAHDGDKETQGFASSRIVTKKYSRNEIEDVVSPRSDKFPEQRTGPDVVVLNAGEETRLS